MDRIETEKQVALAVIAATDQLWSELAARFPTAESGDFPPDATIALEDAMIRAADLWVDYNVTLGRG